MIPKELLPKTKNSPVIRTDFDNEPSWKQIIKLIRKPINEVGEDWYACVEYVDNPAFRNLSVKELLERAPENFGHSFLMVVDKVATSSPEYPILIIDLFAEVGQTFRAIPSQIQGIENNLSIANMSFSDFEDNSDLDSIFRGFKS